MGIYGRDFAAAYNERWGFWGPRLWPFLSKLVARRVPEARTWLDLCCGTGSLLGPVCEAGYEAVGVDLSRHQLKYARRNAPAATLVRADVRELDLGRRFDVITCLFDSLNYLTEPADLLRAFRRARRHLARGGLWVFDVNTLEGIRAHWRQAFIFRDPGRLVINDTSFDEQAGLGHCRITGFVRQGRLYRKFEEHHVERGYTPDETDGLVARAGFAFDKLDAFSLRKPAARSARLLYICWRAPKARRTPS